MDQKKPVKVTKLPRYKIIIMERIVRRCEATLRDVFPHLTKRDYEVATYTYFVPRRVKIYFNEKFVVDLALNGDLSRITSINNVIYPDDKPNITYSKTTYISSNFLKLTRNVHTGISFERDIISFNLVSRGLRIVAIDGSRYLQKWGDI